MKSISVHVSETDYAELKSLAAGADRPVAELIREAMSRFLDEKKQSGPSLSRLEPHASGQLLRGFARDELLDEMIAR